MTARSGCSCRSGVPRDALERTQRRAAAPRSTERSRGGPWPLRGLCAARRWSRCRRAAGEHRRAGGRPRPRAQQQARERTIGPVGAAGGAGGAIVSATLVERRSWRRVRLSLVREQADRPYAVRSAGDVVGLLRAFLRDDPRERFAVVYLDTRHRPIAVHDASTGTANGCMVHPREVFGPAVMLAATAVVV